MRASLSTNSFILFNIYNIFLEIPKVLYDIFQKFKNKLWFILMVEISVVVPIYNGIQISKLSFRFDFQEFRNFINR